MSMGSLLLAGGAPGQADGAAQQPHPHPPAERRLPGPGERHRDPRPRDPRAARARRRDLRRTTPASRSSASTADMERDRFFTAEAARDYGLVDRVIELHETRPASPPRASGRAWRVAAALVVVRGVAVTRGGSGTRGPWGSSRSTASRSARPSWPRRCRTECWQTAIADPPCGWAPAVGRALPNPGRLRAGPSTRRRNGEGGGVGDTAGGASSDL